MSPEKPVPSTGSGQALLPHVHSVTLVHPPHVKLITRAQVMTDKIAALILARLHAVGLLFPVRLTALMARLPFNTSATISIVWALALRGSNKTISLPPSHLTLAGN